jgi:hypothetical protein
VYARIAVIKETAEEICGSPTLSVRDEGAEGQPPVAANSQGQTAAQLYGAFLGACERLFDNELEPLAFEDMMRETFGNKVGRSDTFATRGSHAAKGRVPRLHAR